MATPQPGPDLELDRLSVGYRSGHRWPRRGTDRVVLDQVVGVVPAGVMTVLIGPNGAGKSSLLRTVLGLQPALAGRALLGGRELARMSPRQRARRTAVLLTDRVDAGLMTGREVVELGRHPFHGLLAGGLDGRLDSGERRLVHDTLERLSALDLADRRMSELSDGQKQRLLLARALVQQPELLVLDEPSAFLDVGARVELLALLTELAAERRIVVLLSTHEVELALRMSSSLLVIRDRQLLAGNPDELSDSGVVAEVFGTARTRFDPGRRTFELRG